MTAAAAMRRTGCPLSSPAANLRQAWLRSEPEGLRARLTHCGLAQRPYHPLTTRPQTTLTATRRCSTAVDTWAAKMLRLQEQPL